MSKHRTRGVDVDPDLYFSDRDRAVTRKTEQLRAAIRRVLASALACDVDDPMLEALYVHDVVAEPGGSFAALFATANGSAIDELQSRLRDAAPVFRTALAHALARKRVPQVTYFVVPVVVDAD